MLELSTYARYKSHDDATWSHMVDHLCRFHTVKEVFLLKQASKKAKAKANALGMELMQKKMIDEKTNAETWTPSKMRHEMKASRKYISRKVDMSKELHGDCNFLKINLISVDNRSV